MNDCEKVATETARREYRLFKWTTVLALALCCATSLSLNLVDPDLWGHVRYGQDWLAEGALPRTASHTFTAVDYPWINHENVAELAFATGYQTLGIYGLLIAKCVWGMSILLAMVWVARQQGVHPFAVWALLLLIASNLQAFFPLRPQLLSFGLCAAILVLLDRSFCQWQDGRVRWRYVWLLPIVFVAWVNSHGAFVAGLCITGTFLGGRLLELWIGARPRPWSKMAGLAAVGVSCVVATFVNPYGIEMHRWLIDSLGQPRPEISEWAAPKVSNPIFWPWIGLMGVAFASLAATRRRRDWVHIAVLVLVAWQSALHMRHIAFLALLCGFWLPVHVQSALGRLRPPGKDKLPTMTLSPRLRWLAMSTLLVTIGIQSFAIDRRLSDFPVERNRYPVDALQFMADQNLSGKLVVAFNWAQYAIAALSPEVRVGFDGRFRTCYPQEVVDIHFDFLLGNLEGRRNRSSISGPIDERRVLEFRQPDLVLLDRRYDNAVAVMKAEATRPQPEWVLLYCDRVAELWGRAERFDDPTHNKYVPISARVLDASPRDGSVQWPALPKRKLVDRPENRGIAARGSEYGDNR